MSRGAAKLISGFTQLLCARVSSCVERPMHDAEESESCSGVGEEDGEAEVKALPRMYAGHPSSSASPPRLVGRGQRNSFENGCRGSRLLKGGCEQRTLALNKTERLDQLSPCSSTRQFCFISLSSPQPWSFLFNLPQICCD